MRPIEAAYQKFCEERFPLPSEKQVARLEKRLRVKLPPDYRRFLLEFNGGYFTEPNIVPPSSECPEDCLNNLYGIGAPASHAELTSENHLTLFDDNDPAQILPIGYTLMGNLLILITHPEDRGSIVLKKAFSDESFFLADGIEGFFSLLRVPESDGK